MGKKTETTFQIALEQTTDLKAVHLNLIRKTAEKILWKYPNSEADVEDAVQSVLPGVLNILGNGNKNKIKNTMGYIRRITVNETIKIAKVNNNRQKIELPFSEDGTSVFVEKILSLPERTEIKIIYERKLKDLSLEQRTIVELLVFGMACREIAELMDVKVMVVYKEIYRIRRIMSPLESYLNRVRIKAQDPVSCGDESISSEMATVKERKNDKI